MSYLTLENMKEYLTRSISSINRNKLNGMLAEVEFRAYLNTLGFGDRVSMGGWIFRSEGENNFAEHTVAVFPHTVVPDFNYPVGEGILSPSQGLHAICSNLHQSGIKSYYCTPEIGTAEDYSTLNWKLIQLGVPWDDEPSTLPLKIEGFNRRTRRYNFLRNSTDVSDIPDEVVSEEFSKESLRVSFRTTFMAETSDIDGVFWGSRHTYPLEIKEKTSAHSKTMGEFFGLDVGPFTKLTHYVQQRGNLNSLFIVKEIDNVDSRNLVSWLYITFDDIARFASWVPRGGGRNMGGGSSSVIMIPKTKFRVLDRSALENL